MTIFDDIAHAAPNPAGRDALIEFIDAAIPDGIAFDYPSMVGTPGQLLTVTFPADDGSGAFIRTMFDLGTEDRVVAVWGLSRPEPAGTRDKVRMAGFLGGVWSATYPGNDRGHFFAHTMGGGTDINLFPQLASVNRGGLWREMERYAAEHPGTLCCIRPVYGAAGWRPTELDYAVFKLPPEAPFTVWQARFPN
jgi:hypothetical protein